MPDQKQLLNAIFAHKLSAVKKLLADGTSDPVSADPAGEWRPLHYAAYLGTARIARYLINHGADVGARDERGSTPLYYASKWGGSKVVQLLIEKGALQHLARESVNSTQMEN